jgi:hypothetical protein
MNYRTDIAEHRAHELVDLLDIPQSYYELATDRYQSFADWLHRPQSTVRQFDPGVSPQGSFRYGTVIRPLLKHDEYDLDMVAEFLRLAKSDLSQKALKQMLGVEVRSYAVARQIEAPPEEKKRCWRLDYAGTPDFHMDILPAIPEDAEFKRLLVGYGVSEHLAALAIAITDQRHLKYTVIDHDWPRSNPKGFARWFEDRMRVQATARLRALVEGRAYASVDDVPTWQWKTPLQRSIQILKRHRDVMFRNNCDLAPISMILTTLSAHAYDGGSEIYESLVGILERMPDYVRQREPRVPNPVHPAEDFADGWKSDARLEQNFWAWHARAKADFGILARPLTSDELRAMAHDKLRLDLPEDKAHELTSGVGSIHVKRTIIRPAIAIATAPKPWGRL